MRIPASLRAQIAAEVRLRRDLKLERKQLQMRIDQLAKYRESMTDESIAKRHKATIRQVRLVREWMAQRCVSRK